MRTCDLRDIPMGSADTLKPTQIFDQTDLNCERCQAEGSVQYRVSSDTSDGWIFVCPACWPQFRQQGGIAMGDTRPIDAGANAEIQAALHNDGRRLSHGVREIPADPGSPATTIGHRCNWAYRRC